MTINWNTTKGEFDLISQIANRASALATEAGSRYRVQEALMDLTAAHCNGCPLDLPGLLAATLSDFAHDVFGIARHINRDTGQLEDCFVPRYKARA